MECEQCSEHAARIVCRNWPSASLRQVVRRPMDLGLLRQGQASAELRCLRRQSLGLLAVNASLERRIVAPSVADGLARMCRAGAEPGAGRRLPGPAWRAWANGQNRSFWG